MDYKKFHRTNVIIELAGSTIAAVLAIINLFLAESHPTMPFLLIWIAMIIKSVRIIRLTAQEDYQQESYAESHKTSYEERKMQNYWGFMTSNRKHLIRLHIVR